MDDTELIRRAKQGDRDALERLLKDYEATIKATVYHMIGVSDDTDDVVQDAMIRICQSVTKFRGDASLKTFVTRIAMNTSIDRIRKKKRDRLFFWGDKSDLADALTDDQSPAGEGMIHNSQQRARIHAALMELKPDHRAVISLRYIQDFSTEDTATILNVKVGTVLSRLSRAREQLTKSLGDEWETNDE